MLRRINRPHWTSTLQCINEFEKWFNDQVEPVNRMIESRCELFFPIDPRDPDVVSVQSIAPKHSEGLESDCQYRGTVIGIRRVSQVSTDSPEAIVRELASIQMGMRVENNFLEDIINRCKKLEAQIEE